MDDDCVAGTSPGTPESYYGPRPLAIMSGISEEPSCHLTANLLAAFASRCNGLHFSDAPRLLSLRELVQERLHRS